MNEKIELHVLDLNLKFPPLPTTHNPDLEMTDADRINLLVLSVDRLKHIVREIVTAKPELIKLGPVGLLKVAIGVYERSFNDFHSKEEEARKGFGA